MRIALISPYSWSYPGGVTRHIEGLAEQYLAQGHEVRVLAPVDPVDLGAAVMHRGARPQHVTLPDYLIPLGRTVGFKANGAVSNLSLSAPAMVKLARELSAGRYDVAHIHEPIAPLVGWTATLPYGMPLVGTFHTYSVKRVPNAIATGLGARQVLNRLRVRIAVSDAAAWTGRRWYGGHYRVIPNGVHVDEAALEAALEARRGEVAQAPLRIVFVGQAVERKGLPLLLRAFEALCEHIPAELTVIGPTQAELAPLLMDARGVRALGKVDDQAKNAALLAADVLVAPSLGGESFGMVLTEAFAAGATVVASDIAGYRDVVTDGVDGVLVAPGDPVALAETLRELYYEPQRRHALAQAAALSVRRFVWQRVAEQVMEAYVDAIATPEPVGAWGRLGVKTGFVCADLAPRAPAAKLASLETHTPASARRSRVLRYLRRAAAVGFPILTAALAYLALRKIGFDSVGSALIRSEPSFVVLALAVMCTAMVARALSWHLILKAAVASSRIRFADAVRGIMIGVLMSSTLPARLGEPARALVIARRSGRPREDFPVVLGTLVSQTILNIVALIILGTIMFSSVNFFKGNQSALLAVVLVPVLLLGLVVVAPLALRFGWGAASPGRVRVALIKAQQLLVKVRGGLVVFRHWRLGAGASAAQLSAWALQALSCYLVLDAFGLSSRVGFVGAAAVLFAVNVSAVIPATPANVGVFQAACATVLSTGWHVGWSTGIAYGVVLQAVEITTSIMLGVPALLREGMSWREVRLRALYAVPIKLAPRSSGVERQVGSPAH
ncbi:MAG: lysylphosphatidylglycerol synthase domain-containing protein [Solirubrobacteraceae bacterium]